MIDRLGKPDPTASEVKAFAEALASLRPLADSPVRLIAIANGAELGATVDLGIFPRPSILG